MSKLLTIFNDTKTNKLISLKELYDALELNKSQWARWVKRNIVNNKSFIENKDYIVLEQCTTEKGGRPTKDYVITLDCAKHLAMMCKGEQGHKYREYMLMQERLFKDSLRYIELGRSLQMLLSIYFLILGSSHFGRKPIIIAVKGFYRCIIATYKTTSY